MRVLVVGLPELGAVLRRHDAFETVVVGSGVVLRAATGQALNGAKASEVVIVTTYGADPEVEKTADRIQKAGIRVMILTGVDGAPASKIEGIPTLAAPFTPNDVISALSQLQVDGFLLPLTADDGGDEVFHSQNATPLVGREPPAPALLVALTPELPPAEAAIPAAAPAPASRPAPAPKVTTSAEAPPPWASLPAVEDDLDAQTEEPVTPPPTWAEAPTQAPTQLPPWAEEAGPALPSGAVPAWIAEATLAEEPVLDDEVAAEPAPRGSPPWVTDAAPLDHGTQPGRAVPSRRPSFSEEPPVPATPAAPSWLPGTPAPADDDLPPWARLSGGLPPTEPEPVPAAAPWATSPASSPVAQEEEVPAPEAASSTPPWVTRAPAVPVGPSAPSRPAPVKPSAMPAAAPPWAAQEVPSQAAAREAVPPWATGGPARLPEDSDAPDDEPQAAPAAPSTGPPWAARPAPQPEPEPAPQPQAEATREAPPWATAQPSVAPVPAPTPAPAPAPAPWEQVAAPETVAVRPRPPWEKDEPAPAPQTRSSVGAPPWAGSAAAPAPSRAPKGPTAADPAEMPVWDRRPPKPRPAPPVTPGRDIAVPRPISGPRTLGRQQTVFFAVPKGGTGKTSTSLTFAATLAQALKPFNKSVCWMDGNVQQADGAHYLGATETSRTILDLAGLPVVTDEDMQAILATPAQTGYDMWAVFGPAVKAQANPTVASPELYRMVLQMLRQRFDYVVVDTPVAEHYHRFFTDFVFPCADRLVVVTEPILRTINGVQEWLELIGYPVYAGGHSYNAERVVILLNRAVENINCDEELVRDQLLCKWTWGGSIQLDTDWMKAINQGELPLDNPGVVEALANLATLVTGEAMPVAAGKVGKARVKARGHKRPAKGGFLHRLVG